MRDPRLYEVVAGFASKQNAHASQLAKTMLDERITNKVLEMSRNYRVRIKND